MSNEAFTVRQANLRDMAAIAEIAWQHSPDGHRALRGAQASYLKEFNTNGGLVLGIDEPGYTRFAKDPNVEFWVSTAPLADVAAFVREHERALRDDLRQSVQRLVDISKQQETNDVVGAFVLRCKIVRGVDPTGADPEAIAAGQQRLHQLAHQSRPLALLHGVPLDSDGMPQTMAVHQVGTAPGLTQRGLARGIYRGLRDTDPFGGTPYVEIASIVNDPDYRGGPKVNAASARFHTATGWTEFLQVTGEDHYVRRLQPPGCR